MNKNFETTMRNRIETTFSILKGPLLRKTPGHLPKLFAQNTDDYCGFYAPKLTE
jgi:hypothetical protein